MDVVFLVVVGGCQESTLSLVLMYRQLLPPSVVCTQMVAQANYMHHLIRIVQPETAALGLTSHNLPHYDSI